MNIYINWENGSKKMVFGIMVGMMALFGTLLLPLNAFGATINCNPIPDPCDGTGNADTMFANDGDNSGEYHIHGLAGSDTIIANEIGAFGAGLIIFGGDDDDKISAKRNGGIAIFANGDAGNDLLTLSGDNTQLIEGKGGTGSDRITASGGTNDVALFQDDASNEPDGSKDTLNCGNAPNSKGFISLQDGDVAVNCKVVETSVQP